MFELNLSNELTKNLIYFIAFEIIILAVIFFIFIIKVVLRRRRQEREDILFKMYMEDIFSELFSEDESDIEIAKLSKFEKQIYKRAMINALYDVKGEYKEKLKSKYIDSHFLEDDFKQLSSKEWGVVLAALVAIDTLEPKVIPFHVKKCLKFKNKHIQLCSLKILSKYNLPEKEIFFSSNWMELTRGRKDYVNQIIQNLLAQPEIIYTLSLRDELFDLIFDVIKNNNAIEVAQFLCSEENISSYSDSQKVKLENLQWNS